MTTETDVLEDLIETLRDGAKGFEQSAESLQDEHAEAAATMSELSGQREQFASELQRLAADRGAAIDEDGSAGAAMHRGWISLKDALTGDDASAVLEAAKTGEDHAVEAYEEALESDELSSEVRTTVRQQHDEIVSARDRVRRLAERLDD